MFAKMLSRCLPSKALRPLFSLNPLQKLIFMPCREETCGGKDTAGLECQHTCCATDKKKVQRSQRKIVFNKDCGKAWVDLPVCPDPRCPKPCKNRRGKKKGILYDIKLKILEGGSNFRTPMWRLKCKDPCPPKTKEVKKLPPPPEKKVPATIPKKRKGVQITILGAEQSLGQYIALLLKQCPSIKMIHLYEAEQKEKTCDRDLYKAAADMLMIDTNCNILAYSCTNNELDKSLQSTDIVVVLGSSGPYSNAYNPLINRFYSFAPQMVNYAESISHECPRACVLICATPVELMVPLFAEVMKETGWYDPTKLFGSVAISESRASTLAARSLSLHPLYTRVPCVIGTEGETLVPLFSKSVEYFDFTEQSLFSLTDALRKAPVAVARTECCGLREAELSEAYAIANLVKKISYALLCQDHPRFFSYIDTNCSIDVALMRYLSCEVELNGSGISRYFELPKMNEYEIALADHAITTLEQRMYIMEDWYLKYLSCVTPTEVNRKQFFIPKHFDHVQDCAYATFN